MKISLTQIMELHETAIAVHVFANYQENMNVSD